MREQREVRGCGARRGINNNKMKNELITTRIQMAEMLEGINDDSEIGSDKQFTRVRALPLLFHFRGN